MGRKSLGPKYRKMEQFFCIHLGKRLIIDLGRQVGLVPGSAQTAQGWAEGWKPQSSLRISLSSGVQVNMKRMGFGEMA